MSRTDTHGTGHGIGHELGMGLALHWMASAHLHHDFIGIVVLDWVWGAPTSYWTFIGLFSAFGTLQLDSCIGLLTVYFFNALATASSTVRLTRSATPLPPATVSR